MFLSVKRYGMGSTKLALNMTSIVCNCCQGVGSYECPHNVLISVLSLIEPLGRLCSL